MLFIPSEASTGDHKLRKPAAEEEHERNGGLQYSTSPTEGEAEKKIPAYYLEPAIRNLLNS